ncbi:MAG: scyllo-inositol 2-dehydrogenase [Ilumatobacteraceae bacterium]|nr:scyllo-inositol 2-dehydrogenase [Ilumatobacteraceae bacterium]
MTVGIGIIGLGRLGQVRARALATRVDGARLVAVTDLDPALADSTAARYGAVATRSAAELVGRDDIDGVVVATPTSVHVAPVELVAGAGKALFCEKPLASTMADHRHLVDIIDRAGVACMVGFNRRCDPEFLDARRLIVEGAIGKPTYLHGRMRDPFPPPPWARDPGAGGGLFIDMLIHDFDSARMLLAQEVTQVFAQSANLVVDAGDIVGFADNATVALEFESGALGQMHSSMHAAYGYDVRTEVFGERGTIEIGSLQRHNVMLAAEGRGLTHPDTFLPEGDIPHAMFRFGAAYEAEMAVFAEVVTGARTAPANHHDALAAFRVAAAARESQRRNQPVQIAEISGS